MSYHDNKLFWRHLFSSVLLLFSLVTVAIAWGHWAYTLDTCSGYNCGCILFGIRFSTGFTGGNIQYCQFVTFVQIPIFIISVIYVFYYGFRTFLKKRRVSHTQKKLLQSKRGKGDSRVLDSKRPESTIDPPSKKLKIASLVLSIIISLTLLITAVILTSGFYSSCGEYRKFLVQELAVTGNSAQVVGSRISCVSIFDFLDYLQPDRVEFNEPHLQYSRKDRINTGVTLMIAKTTLFMNFVNWVFMTTLHIRNLWKLPCCHGKEAD